MYNSVNPLKHRELIKTKVKMRKLQFASLIKALFSESSA